MRDLLIWRSLAVVSLGATAAFGVAQTGLIEQLKRTSDGVEVLMEGDRVSRLYGAPMSQGNSASESADRFMAAYSETFGPGASSFEPAGTQDVMNGKFTVVYFRQVVNGVPVDQSNVSLLVRENAEHPLVLAVNGARPVSPVGTKPLLTEIMALQVAAQRNKRLEVFSDPALCVHVGESETRLAWSFSAESPSLQHPEKFKVFVDAHSGAILEWRDDIHYVDVAGSVKGFASPGLLPDQPNNPAQLTDLFDAEVSIPGVVTANAASNGTFTLPNPGSTPVTVSSVLEGRWVRVVDNTGTTFSFSQLVTPPGPVDFIYNPSPTVMGTSQVNGLIHTTKVHDFVKSINPNYPGVDIQMPCNVNVAGQGNAFYNGSSINFYNAGGVFPNTCYSTVVYHEYGHHIVNVAGTLQNGYGEGMGDVTAVLLGNTSNLGMDFRGQGTGPLRNAINTITHPSYAAIHTHGQILSGSFWLTLQAMTTAYGSTTAHSVLCPLWLNSILLRPLGISPAITIDLLTLDDNDANLANGTPHYDTIAAGFNPKGLTAPVVPFVNMTTISLPTQVTSAVDGTGLSRDSIPFVVQLTNNLETVNPAAVRLMVAQGTGGYQAMPMAAIGANRYRSIIRSLAPGQSLRYYIETTTQQGRVFSGPLGTAKNFLSLVGRRRESVLFSDSFETDLGWTPVNNNLSAGAWTRANPNGTTNGTSAANPENDSGDAGSNCLFTGQGTVGAAVGTADVDGGPTYMISPTFDASGGNAVLDYSRWFYNDDGEDFMSMEVSNDNGATWVLVDWTMSGAGTNSWVNRSIVLGNWLPITNQMRLRVGTSDNPNNSITEAAIDQVMIRRL